MDHLSPEGRSRVMRAIRSSNTKPELALRAALRASGQPGYRLHRKDLPGRPDIAFVGRKVAVFVDGAYWHGHPDHWHPEAASDYWKAKIARNQERDKAANGALEAMGWTVLRFWDFEVKQDAMACAARITQALAQTGPAARTGPGPGRAC
ncbi:MULTISPECIES: very short patch repair endonuclease [unclassified Luteococcus]|uniref:very short patch repair endonuclease n=1 Tax=unclassified Luteococcus TaxID=2639923 RepID=UPI00313AE1D5